MKLHSTSSKHQHIWNNTWTYFSRRKRIAYIVRFISSQRYYPAVHYASQSNHTQRSRMSVRMSFSHSKLALLIYRRWRSHYNNCWCYLNSDANIKEKCHSVSCDATRSRREGKALGCASQSANDSEVSRLVTQSLWTAARVIQLESINVARLNAIKSILIASWILSHLIASSLLNKML